MGDGFINEEVRILKNLECCVTGYWDLDEADKQH